MHYIKENMEITDIYRIYIGSDNKTNKINESYLMSIKHILNEFNLSYTLINAHGYWNYTQEDSLIIEIINTYTDNETITHTDIYNTVKTIAENLKEELKQMAVLITKQCIKYEVI